VSEINKKELSEIDICDLYITQAIKDAGRDQLQQIRREVPLTPGPLTDQSTLTMSCDRQPLNRFNYDRL
jgi:type I restriction enzyme, R subunit